MSFVSRNLTQAERERNESLTLYGPPSKPKHKKKKKKRIKRKTAQDIGHILMDVGGVIRRGTGKGARYYKVVKILKPNPRKKNK